MSDGKLGKRYVHVINGEPWPIMTERPGDIADSRRQATIEVDLDAARPVDRDEYEHAERTWVNAYAECQRLRPDKRPDDVLAAELVRLRGQVAAMSKVVDAATTWAGESPKPTYCLGEPQCNWNQYAGAVIHDDDCPSHHAFRDLHAAVDAYRSGQPTTPAAVDPATLTPQECQLAIDALGFWSSDDNDAPHEDIDRLRDRLRRGSPAPRLTSADLARLRDAYLESVQAGPYQISSNMYTGDACAAYRELRRVLSDLNAAGKLGGEVGP